MYRSFLRGIYKLEQKNIIFDTNSIYIKRLQSENDNYEKEHGRRRCGFVLTFGCQQNEADGEKIKGILLTLGYNITDTPDAADIIVVNTCAIRAHAEEKALSIVGQYKHLKAKNPDLIIAICGCMTAQESRRNDIKFKYPYVDIAIGTASLHKLPELICERRDREKRQILADDDYNIAENIPVIRDSSYRAWVSIMYGCNNFCSYCIVPYVRGRERSRRREEIIAEVTALAKEGYKDITLLGQNVNSYGKDLYEDYAFADLLSELAKIEGDFKLKFMTSHPKDASDKLIEVMRDNPKIARHFHLPLQSGSDKVLSEMNRKYDSERYMLIVKKLRAAMPDIAITSDIIVGFPGETEEDFEATLDVIRRAEFDMIYSFIYSPRNGTPASKLDTQIPPEIKSARFDRLLETQNEISKRKNQKHVGQTLRVLIDGKSKNNENVWSGRTEANKIVLFDANGYTGSDIGTFKEMVIERADTFALYTK